MPLQLVHVFEPFALLAPLIVATHLWLLAPSLLAAVLVGVACSQGLVFVRRLSEQGSQLTSSTQRVSLLQDPSPFTSLRYPILELDEHSAAQHRHSIHRFSSDSSWRIHGIRNNSNR
ncbi:uncharacterized protein EV422DRAFT_203321 [Fimicolochytrium jonesii]|uniref:uncharacterized protein n=1 Tax=Fimicolochytrium jonesii TaxID=1396493 RepID=UPI0022FEAB47|nr:uncharacterized protein EV422DRAFT_203321 [Fimicolochytrium jonesii]KAI8818028.1 hypothetical protein EV422DRAFT_203321 [Fimicolochytrium jonesii]